jgi:hypothetical protein
MSDLLLGESFNSKDLGAHWFHLRRHRQVAVDGPTDISPWCMYPPNNRQVCASVGGLHSWASVAPKRISDFIDPTYSVSWAQIKIYVLRRESQSLDEVMRGDILTCHAAH